MDTISRQHQITEGNIWKQLLIFFFPILMGSFFQQMYNTVDTIIVGRVVGTTALAAVGSTGALVNMLNGFFLGVGSGASVILSQFYGAGDQKGVDEALHTGMKLSLLLGLTITVLGAGFGPLVLIWINTPENCIGPASTYLRLYFLGAMGSMVYNMGAGILRARGDSRRPTIFLIISCFINIAMDLLLVAVLRLGVAGAALATSISQFISAAMVVLALCRLPDTPLTLSKLRINRKLLKRILMIGVPAGMQFVTFDFANILIQSGINSFGDVTMAAMTAYTKTDGIIWMVSGAFGVSVTTFAGQNFGARKLDRVRQSVWACMALSVGTIGAISLLIYTFRIPILGIYTTDPEVIRVGAYVVTVVYPFNICFMPVEVLGGTMRGTGNSLLPTLITGCCVCLFRVIWLLTVVQWKHTLFTLLLCYPVSWVLASSVFFLVYFRGGWLRSALGREEAL